MVGHGGTRGFTMFYDMVVRGYQVGFGLAVKGRWRRKWC